MRTITSALYVDFDNVFSGLAQLDRATAEAFANDPGRLLEHLSRGTDESGQFRRRFLVRDCYINPHSFARYRAQFVAAGFRVIDCPSLTQRGKSAADTHIVIDVVDAISHATRYDEFVICSADADFSPLMTKLRRHDRRTLMIAAGNAAPAYQAVCDFSMGAMEIVAAFTTASDAVEDAQLGAAVPLTLAEDEMVTLAAEAVRARLAASEGSVPGSSAAAAAGRAVPNIAKTGWAGSGGFAAFIRQHLPELTYVSTDSGGLVVAPGRHTSDGVAEAEEPGSLTAKVARVTKVPPLTSEQYAVLFTELAEVAKQQPRLARIGYDVRERAAESAAPVPRKSVDFVVTGLVYAGCDPRIADVGARELAERWLANVLYLCDQAGLELDQADRDSVSKWILAGLGHEEPCNSDAD